MEENYIWNIMFRQLLVGFVQNHLVLSVLFHAGLQFHSPVQHDVLLPE